MSHISHKTMVIIGEPELISDAMVVAADLGLPTTGMTRTAANRMFLFYIPPCGSKEGWNEAEKHDEALGKFAHRLSEPPFVSRIDRTPALSWAVVHLDRRDGPAEIIAGDSENMEGK